MLLIILLTITWISYTLTLFLEKIFIRYKVFIDSPSERSCHNKPTPTAGGLAILFSYGIFIFFLMPLFGENFNNNINIFHSTLWSDTDNLVSSSYDTQNFSILVVAIIPIIVIGLLDDFMEINIFIRLLVQFFSASLIIYHFQLNNDAPSYVDFFAKQSSLLIAILSIILSMWLINIYNFMDGIDGYACLECIFICITASILAYLNDMENLIYVYLAVLGAANIGFIFRNWYPAKIFMGDTGSVSTGCILAFFIFYSASESILSIYTWLILLSIFIADASYTLLVRIVTKKNIFKAHLTHAFHKITIKENSHIFTIKCMMLVNLIWVLPMAVLSNIYIEYHIIITIITYSPFLFFLIRIGAGLETDADL